MSDDSSHQIDLPNRDGLSRYLPSWRWARSYKPSDLPRDALAGLFVAILLIPQAMAYAALADLSPTVGLYAAVAPALLYAVFGTSRFLAIGPVALVSLLTGEAIASAGQSGDLEAAQVALVLALLVGAALLLMGLLRLGFLVNFISDPVLSGFTSAAAVLIATSQLRTLLGVDAERGDGFVGTLGNIWGALGTINWVTLLLGASLIALLILAKAPLQKLLERTSLSERLRLVVRQSVPLLLVVASTLATWGFALNERAGVAIVGELAGGLPPLTLQVFGPLFQPALWLSLLPSALVIAAVLFVTGVAVATSLAGQRRQHIDPDQEAIALGAANLAAALTGGYPVGASISRSAINFDAGARTPAASAITALVVLLTVTFLSGIFYFLPRVMLAALITTAVVGLFDVAAMRRTWRYSRAEFAALAITFVAVLALGIDLGIVVGAAAGLAVYLYQTSEPRIVVEGEVEGQQHLRSTERDFVEPLASTVLPLRIDQDLYFANVRHCEARVLEEVAHHSAENGGVRCLLLDLKSVSQIDSSGSQMLNRLVDNLEAAEIKVGLAGAKRPVADALRQSGLVERLGEEHLFLTAHEGVETLRERYVK